MFFVYILFSESNNRYYIRQSNNLEDRIHRHNSGYEIATKSGTPWKLIHHFQLQTRSEAMLLEKKIKKRDAKRFLDDLNNEQ
ncbi:GIY-YIG nuclease family protein [Flavobacterium sp.]|uniref:GIY-YIG nuclease family protein n=1 Tax=Flavobacterium sp. TaxID=239 RepID=UPI0038FD0D2C